MISRDTVFVLGAGASVPYGYPTGAELRADIINETNRRIFLLKAKGDPIPPKFIADTKEFVEAFKKSGVPSIDLYLSRVHGFAEVGKIAIILSILEHERTSAFNEERLGKLWCKNKKLEHADWYSYLYHRMTETLDDPYSYGGFSNNEVKFITFNYDRSLEFALHQMFTNSFYEEGEENLLPHLKKFPIIHVYGSIDCLPWEAESGTSYQSDSIGWEKINKLAENIKLIYERKDIDKQRIKDLLADAKRVVFLGFGYAGENLKVLGYPSIYKDKNVFGTCYGFTDLEQNKIKNYFSAEGNGNRISFHGADQDNLMLLRGHLN